MCPKPPVQLKGNAGFERGVIHQHLGALQLVAHEQTAVLPVQKCQRPVGMGGDIQQLNRPSSQVDHIPILHQFAREIRVGQLGDVKGQTAAGAQIGLRAGVHQHRLPFAAAAGVIQVAVGQCDSCRLDGELLHIGAQVARAPAGVNEQGRVPFPPADTYSESRPYS